MRIVPATAALVLVLAAPAMASSVSIAPPATGASAARLVYDAAPGEANVLTVSYSRFGDIATVTDPGATIDPDAGCTAVDAHTATCEALVGDDGSFGETRVSLGNADDSVVTEGNDPPTLIANG